jgi:Ca2+-binding RTX toxin-like protein
MTVTATDAGGTTSAVASREIVAAAVAVVADPADPTRRVLAVGGTDGADTIRVAADGGGALKVRFGADPWVTFPAPAGGFARVLVYAGDGADVVTVADAVTVPARLDGGAGNDTLSGGAGDDSLQAVAGNDVLCRPAVVCPACYRPAAATDDPAAVCPSCGGLLAVPLHVRKRPLPAGGIAPTPRAAGGRGGGLRRGGGGAAGVGAGLAGAGQVSGGDHAGAALDFGEVIRLDPGRPSGHKHRSLARFRRSEFRGAAQDLGTATHLDPDDQEVSSLLAELQRRVPT